MLEPELLDRVRCIAYDPRCKGIDRVEACKTLYANATDTEAIIQNLQEIITVSQIAKDSEIIKAANLLHKIKNDIGKTVISNQVDVAATANELIIKYTGGGMCQEN